MKPVVSSLVALAIAIAPISAFAKPAHKTPHAKVAKGRKADKAHRADKSESSEEAPIVRVKASGSRSSKKGALKPVVHHAHNVDLGGAGHREPKVDRGGAIVPASMKTPAAHGRAAHAKPIGRPSDLPKLPAPGAGKPSKGGAEKGARRGTEKKSEASDPNDGEPTRDEEFAELVARIRGRHPVTGNDDDKGADRTTSSPAGGADVTRDARAKNASHTVSKAPCLKDPVEIVRGPEVERFALTKCDGSIAPLAIEHLSVLIRPGGAARPVAPLAELAKKPGSEIAHGVRRVDPRLLERIQHLADHFGKAGAPAKLFVISGYRPASVGSMHSTGRAVDFRVEGVKNEEVVAFCKTLADTGCGYYPNSSFVHVDVRDTGAGHVSWIDASGPGETPRYVTSWPPPGASATHHLHRTGAMESLADEGESLLRARRPLDRESLPETADEHPADVAP